MSISSASGSYSVAIVGLVLFAAFLVLLGSLAYVLYRVIRGSRREGESATPGCLLGCGFGGLMVVFAVLALGALTVLGAMTVGVQELPHVRQELREWRQELRDSRRSGHEEFDSQRSAEAERQHSNSTEMLPAEREEEARQAPGASAEAERVSDPVRQAMDDALKATEDAGRAAAEAVEQAREATAEASRAAAEILKEIERAAQGGGSGLAGRHRPVHLRVEVRGQAPDGLVEAVRQAAGERPELTVYHKQDAEGREYLVYDFGTNVKRDRLAQVEDELKKRLADLKLPEGSRVEFLDTLLQD